MNLLHAILLGVLQGLTEFIPISSSAHLIVVPKLLNWQTPGLTFDVALHLGTLLALLVYFWRDWYDILRSHLATRRAALALRPEVVSHPEAFLLWPIIIACVPAVVAGFFLDTLPEHTFRGTQIIAVNMIVLGVLLFFADRISRKRKPMRDMTARDWLIIGFAQALALIPGVSRSGVTITAGLFCGLQREAAARFSFLLGTPIILGAAGYKLLTDVVLEGLPASEVVPFLAGIASAAVVGYLCIGFLMSYLRKRSMDIFVGYRLVFGAVMIILPALGYVNW